MEKNPGNNKSRAERIDEIRAKKIEIENDAWSVADVLFDSPPEVEGKTFRSILYFVSILGVDATLDAAEIALIRTSTGSANDLFRYFCGVCWNLIRAQGE